jgi:hypothetical protein
MAKDLELGIPEMDWSDLEALIHMEDKACSSGETVPFIQEEKRILHDRDIPSSSTRRLELILH